MEIKTTSETTSNKVFRVATAVNRMKRCQELGQIFPDHLSVMVQYEYIIKFSYNCRAKPKHLFRYRKNTRTATFPKKTQKWIITIWRKLSVITHQVTKN